MPEHHPAANRFFSLRWRGKFAKRFRDILKYWSPILAGDLLFCAREDGVVMSIKVSDEGMELLSENDMAERLAASPVPVRDKLLIRGENHLFLIGK